MQYDLCKESNEMNWMDMLYYNPKMVTSNLKNNIPLENHIHGIELMSLRSGWDNNASFLSLHLCLLA